MGPEATAAFYEHLIEVTPARRDQDHLTVVIYSEPGIPDRTEYLVADGPSPLPELVRVAQTVEKAGAELIAIPCNTAHYFWEAISQAVEIPVLNIIDETVSSVEEAFESGLDARRPRIGVMSTMGTARMGFYENALRAKGLDVVPVSESFQQGVMRIITEVKAGNDRAQSEAFFRSAVTAMTEQGAEGVILGCTELGLARGKGEFPVPIFDSLKILAEATVKAALGVGWGRHGD
jgi:aspartate racemase